LDKLLTALLDHEDASTLKARVLFCTKVKVLRELLVELYHEDVSGYGIHNESDIAHLVDVLCRSVIMGAMMIPPPLFELAIAGAGNIYRTVWSEKVSKSPQLREDSTQGLAEHVHGLMEQAQKRQPSG
jgi:hypothetical protein